MKAYRLYLDQPICPYDSASLADGRDIGDCPDCKTPHHVECWSLNGGCTTAFCYRNPAMAPRTGFAYADLENKRSARQALDELRKAIREESEYAIVEIWEKWDRWPEHLLRYYEAAREYHPRVDLARKRCELLEQMDRILVRGNNAEIYRFHAEHSDREPDPNLRLESIKDYREKHQDRTSVVVASITRKLGDLKTAIGAEDGQGDDRAIEMAYDEVLRQLTPIFQHQKLLSDNDIKRIDLALKRMPALRTFEGVLTTNSHRAIAEAWDRNRELFREFRLAEAHLPLVKIAKQCVQKLSEIERHHALEEWRGVIAVFDSWREHFEDCKDYRESYQACVEIARRQIALLQLPVLKQALADGDDLKVSEIYIPSIFDGSLTPGEQEWAKLAVRRVPIVQQMQEAFARKDLAHLVKLYDENAASLQLKQCKAFTGEMRFAVIKARQELALTQLEDALKSENENQIVHTADAAIAVGCILEPSILQRVIRIKRKQAACERYRKATTDVEKLLAYDEELLGDDPAISNEVAEIRQRHLPLLALRYAIGRKDVREVSTLVAQNKGLEAHPSETERAYVAFAIETHNAIQDLEQALASGDVEAIAHAYKPELEPFLTDLDRERAQSALAIRQYLLELKELSGKSETARDKVAIAQKYKEAKANGVLMLDSLDWETVQEALEFEARWKQLKDALDASDIDATFESWIPGRFHPYYQELSDEQRRCLLQTIRYVGARERLKQALDSRDPQRVAFAYQPELLNERSEDDRELIKRAEELLKK